MELLKSLQVSASGMTAERVRLEVVSANIANANATRTANGDGPYQRRVPVVKATPFDDIFQGKLKGVGDPEVSVPVIIDVQADQSQGPMVFDPSHPDANPEGYVNLPNVNIVTEMVDMMSASRAYEANLNAVDATKDMAAKSLEIGR